MQTVPVELGALSQEPFAPPVQDYLMRGLSALTSGQLDEAREFFEQAVHRDPFDAGAHANLSKVYWRMNRAADSLGSLTRALELDPDDREVILHCREVFVASGKSEDAKEILQCYVARNPWDDEVRKELAGMATINSVERALDAHGPTFPMSDLGSVFNEQGEKQFEQGKLDHAKACFEMALEHNPNLAQAHSNLGVLCWQQGDLKKALDLFYQALELDSEDLDIVFNTSKALAAAGELETAANFLKLYLQQNPRDEAAWADYASLVQSLAYTAWNPAGLDGEVSHIYLKMGRDLAVAKDFMGAAQAFERAIQLDEKQGEPFLGLAKLHIQLGQEDDALKILRTGLEMEPTHKGCVLLAGEILVAKEEPQEAGALYGDYLKEVADEDVQAALDALDDLPEPAAD